MHTANRVREQEVPLPMLKEPAAHAVQIGHRPVHEEPSAKVSVVVPPYKAARAAERVACIPRQLVEEVWAVLKV